jgi:hypothetical protein
MTFFSEGGEAARGVDIGKLRSYSFEIGAIRPPSEGGSLSLLLRVTRNCPWNRCTFCYGNAYNHQRFELRSVDEVKADIDSVKAIGEEIKALSWRLGYGGSIEPLANIVQSGLLYNKNPRALTAEEVNNFHSVVNVFNWLCAGAKTVFLQAARRRYPGDSHRPAC